MRALTLHNRLSVSAICLLFSLPVLTQQQPASPESSNTTDRQAQAKVKNVAASKESKETKLTDDQKLAYETLEVSEGSARAFQAPMRSYELLQIGSTFATLDSGKARSLLSDAFRASLEIHDDPGTKSQLQQEIFRVLLPLSQADVEELLLQAEPSVRKPTTDLIVGRYAEKKEFDKAFDLINQYSASAEFPYGSASRLMDALPPEMAAEKQTLFTQAIASFKSHEHKSPLVGMDTLTSMITRFGPSMPPRLVLQGIDEILSQTKAASDQQQAASMMLQGPSGSVSFASAYQFQLFALLPLLQKLDPAHAQQLLDDNQQVQAQLQQYPQGLNSITPSQPSGPAKPAGAGTGAGTGSGSATNSVRSSFTRTITSDKQGPPGSPGAIPQINAAQDYLRQDTLRKMEEIRQLAATDPTQALARCSTLPAQMDGMGGEKSSPRAQALEQIARSNATVNPTAAETALSEIRKTITDLPPRTKVQFLSSAADVYVQMGAKETAEKVVSEGLKAADKLLEEDTNPDSPNQALKAWWPSTDAYRRFVEVQAKISGRSTLSVLKEIKDPEIRTTESIMFARSLLGLPLKRSTVVEKRGDNTMSMTTDSN
jgi:hypothetical protein